MPHEPEPFAAKKPALQTTPTATTSSDSQLVLLIDQVLSAPRSLVQAPACQVADPKAADVLFNKLLSESASSEHHSSSSFNQPQSLVTYDHESEGQALLLASVKKSSMTPRRKKSKLAEKQESSIDNVEAMPASALAPSIMQARRFLFSSIANSRQSALAKCLLRTMLWYDQLSNLFFVDIDRIGKDGVFLESGDHAGGGWQSDCTHLIAGCPSRSEKYLAAMVSGAWILKPEYIEASLKAREWLSEEGFVWRANDYPSLGNDKIGK